MAVDEQQAPQITGRQQGRDAARDPRDVGLECGTEGHHGREHAVHEDQGRGQQQYAQQDDHSGRVLHTGVEIAQPLGHHAFRAGLAGLALPLQGVGDPEAGKMHDEQQRHRSGHSADGPAQDGELGFGRAAGQRRLGVHDAVKEGDTADDQLKEEDRDEQIDDGVAILALVPVTDGLVPAGVGSGSGLASGGTGGFLAGPGGAVAHFGSVAGRKGGFVIFHVPEHSRAGQRRQEQTLAPEALLA